MKVKFTQEVKKNILWVSVGSIILCGIVLLVALLIGQFTTSVLVGALIGTFITIANFILLAFSLQKAVDKPESGKGIAGISYFLRNLMLLLLSIAAILFLKVNVIALLIPYIFPRIVILVLQATGKYQQESSTVPKGGDADGN